LSGDFNAKIGTGAPIGKHALGSQNDNGERLVQFAQADDLVAANAMVRRHVRRMYTWKSHDGAHRNQIDYSHIGAKAMVEQRQKVQVVPRSRHR